MFSESELAVIRRAYAKQILAVFRVDDERVEAAFAQVRREHYLGPGPLSMLRYEDYVLTPDADPVHLYVNTLVGIIPERKLNNGEPALHALLIAAAAPAPGACPPYRRGDRLLHCDPGAPRGRLGKSHSH